MKIRKPRYVFVVTINTILRLILEHEELREWFKKNHTKPGLKYQDKGIYDYLKSQINELINTIS